MDAQTIDTIAPRQARSSRRVKAVLAGGLVLGIGAAVTLAAWTDQEFASGTFQAGRFNLEGSTDGTAFADHDDALAPAALTFTLSPTELSPGTIVTAPFAVRLDADTTANADVAVTVQGTTGSLTGLTYSLAITDEMGCTGASTDLFAGAALNTVPADTAFALSKGATTGTAGEPAYLCFTVTAGPTLTQGQQGTVTWAFTATSE